MSMRFNLRDLAADELAEKMISAAMVSMAATQNALPGR